MKIFQLFRFSVRHSTRRCFHALLVGIMLLIALPILKGQPTLFSDEIKEAIETIAKYTGASINSDLVGHHLEQVGYNPPEHLKNEWQKWPTVARISMAYRAAANVSPENGEKFLALMSQNQAQQYQSAQQADFQLMSADKRLLHFLDLSIPPGTLTFKHIELETAPTLPDITNETIKFSLDVKKGIVALAQYLEGNAVGSMSRVLTEFCNLSDEDAFDILEKSRSNKEALVNGLSRMSGETAQKEAMQKIAREFKNSYQPAANDEGIREILGWEIPKKIPLKKTIALGGHNISEIDFAFTIEKTEKTLELIISPDFGSLKLIIDPTALSKLDGKFFQESVKKISQIEKVEDLETIEKGMLEKLLATTSQPVQTAEELFNSSSKSKKKGNR